MSDTHQNSGSSLPPDLDALLERVGDEPIEIGEGYEFCPRGAIKTAHELSDGDDYLVFPGNDRMLVFCDYLAWCWGFAVALDEPTEHGHAVYLVGREPVPIRVASSVSEFVAMVECDSMALHP